METTMLIPMKSNEIRKMDEVIIGPFFGFYYLKSMSKSAIRELGRIGLTFCQFDQPNNVFI